jgi:hypothetical protein
LRRKPVSQQAVIQEARAEDYRICRLKPNAEAFGALMDFLAGVKPFSQFRAGPADPGNPRGKSRQAGFLAAGV